MIIPKAISGFKELLPEEELIQQKVIEVIKEGYSNAGFMPLETSLVERNEIILAKGGIDNKEIYTLGKLGESGDKELSLKFDQTVPFARYVAQNYGQLIYPFKRYQIQKVFRGERPAEGRFREFYQADIDIIGDKVLSKSYDAEILSVISSIFKKLNIGGFTIKVNNRKLQLGLMESLEIKETTEILRILDKLDKLDAKDVFELLLEFTDATNANTLLTFSLDSFNDIDKLEQFCSNDTYQEGIVDLKDLIEEAYLLGVDKENLVIDPKIARGLDYYTGVIYETFLDDYIQLGSICSGGRYDNLASTYTKQILPGVGVSIGVSRLIYIILKYNLIEKASQKNAKYMIFTSSNKKEMLLVAKDLREQGLSCEISFLNNYKKEMKLAQKKGYQYIVIPKDNSIIIRDILEKDRTLSDIFLKQI